ATRGSAARRAGDPTALRHCSSNQQLDGRMSRRSMNAAYRLLQRPVATGLTARGLPPRALAAARRRGGARRAGGRLGCRSVGLGRVEGLERGPAGAGAFLVALCRGTDQETGHRVELPDGAPPAVRPRAAGAGVGAVVLRVVVLVVGQELP